MKDFTRVIRAAERAGLHYVHGRKHGKLLDPRSGRSVPISNTPSCTNAHRRVISDVRKFLGVSIV